MWAYSMGVQGQVKTPPLVTPPQENPKPKTENFFWLGTTRLAEAIEGLNTSLAAAADEL